MEDRNKSLEPVNVPQEDVREFRKEEEVAFGQEAGVPEQIEIEADKDILGELADIAEAELVQPDPEPEPLSEPSAEVSVPEPSSDFPILNVEVPTVLDEASHPTGQVLSDLADIAKSEGKKPSKSQQRRQAFQDRPRAANPREAHQMRAAAKRAEHGQVMVELGNKANEKAEEDKGHNGMPRGEAEQLHFPNAGGADALTEAYKRYIEADKQRWKSLIDLLTDTAMEITFARQELDQIRGLLERERI